MNDKHEQRHLAMGWMHAEACHMADAGQDIRSADIGELCKRMNKDLDRQARAEAQAQLEVVLPSGMVVKSSFTQAFVDRQLGPIEDELSLIRGKRELISAKYNEAVCGSNHALAMHKSYDKQRFCLFLEGDQLDRQKAKLEVQASELLAMIQEQDQENSEMADEQNEAQQPESQASTNPSSSEASSAQASNTGGGQASSPPPEGKPTPIGFNAHGSTPEVINQWTQACAQVDGAHVVGVSSIDDYKVNGASQGNRWFVFMVAKGDDPAAIKRAVEQIVNDG